jgi:hypothetical protein
MVSALMAVVFFWWVVALVAKQRAEAGNPANGLAGNNSPYSIYALLVGLLGCAIIAFIIAHWVIKPDREIELGVVGGVALVSAVVLGMLITHFSKHQSASNYPLFGQSASPAPTAKRGAHSTAGWHIVCKSYYPQAGGLSQAKPCLGGRIRTRQPVSVDYTIEGMSTLYSTLYGDQTVVERFHLFNRAGQQIGIEGNPPTDNTGESFVLHLNSTAKVVVRLICSQRGSLCHHVGKVLWTGRFTTHISR